MRIVLLSRPEGNVIARENQLGRLEGEFVVDPDGRVYYHHPWDNKPWFSGEDAETFRQATEAWNRYCDEGQKCQSEQEGKEAVDKLRDELSRLALLEAWPDNIWPVLLEQAEFGLL